MPEEQNTLATLPMGTLLRGRYLIKNVLGTGSTGTVYLVKDQQARDIKYQLFALKEISGLDQQARYQFTFSGTALRQLQYPALPIIHQIFNDDKRGCVYLVMDYVEGINLATLRLQQPAQRLSWSELRAFCEAISGALTYLHLQENPLFHGDIKPTNVMLNIAGRTMLIDPGYAQAATPDHMRQISANALSHYRAPEQFAGKIDALSDVYGLGATLYELLTGHAPVDALTRLERVNKKKSDPLALASKVAPGVPRSLAEAIQKALALDPSERFRSIKEFWQTLSALPVPEGEAAPAAKQKMPAPVPLTPADSAVSTRSSGSSPEIRIVRVSEPRHSPWPTIVILCVLLLLLTGAGTWVWASSRSHASTPNRPGASYSPVAGSPTATSGPGKYTNILGKYVGYFNYFDKQGNPTPRIPFTLVVSQQNQSEFRGTFDSPGLSGKVNGSIDLSGEATWTVLDASGNAVLSFSGGLNGIFGSQTNTNDSGGGVLSKCQPDQGSQCIPPDGPNNGGVWDINFASSA